MSKAVPSATPTNLIGIHAGVWVSEWSAPSARHAITQSAESGFDLIEIPVPNLGEADPDHTRELLADNDLTGVVSLALSSDSDINTTDAELSSRGEQRLNDAVRFARDIGADYVGGVLYSKMAKYDHAPTDAGRENSLAVLRRVAEKAGAADIRLGLEYVNRYESNLLNTAAQTVQFITDLGAPNVLLHLDTYHANSEEAGQPSAVRDAGGLLGYIHAAENHRGALGAGSIDWSALFNELFTSGYPGPITFESFSGAVLSAETANDIGLWRSLWTDPARLARHANAFLRTHLADASRSADIPLASASH